MDLWAFVSKVSVAVEIGPQLLVEFSTAGFLRLNGRVVDFGRLRRPRGVMTMPALHSGLVTERCCAENRRHEPDRGDG
jgi:hypothetical protein